jgi:glyoxylase-like metal-dependent hydrolase (beta-lactamase superfamily II)
MDKVSVLVEGYAYMREDGSTVASPTTSLIETNGKKILVDPGTNKEKLLAAMAALKLTSQDIDLIYLTHYHPDHFLNIRLFPDVDIFDGEIHWKGDEEFFHEKNIPGTNIEILPTPGHSPEHTSLLVNTNEGVVCIAQDVFWWKDGEQKSDTEEDLLKIVDAFASDPEMQVRSRKLVLAKADWIIPGHGKKFRNPRRATA